MKYIHYGSNRFNPKAFKKVKNTDWIKPKGGLWASPTNAQFGWKEWCIQKHYVSTDYFNKSFTFYLTPNARILTIKEKSDICHLNAHSLVINNGYIKKKYKNHKVIDYEKLQKKYDAIVFLIPAIHDSRLYWIDCESIIVLNKNVIITEERRYR